MAQFRGGGRGSAPRHVKRIGSLLIDPQVDIGFRLRAPLSPLVACHSKPVVAAAAAGCAPQITASVTFLPLLETRCEWWGSLSLRSACQHWQDTSRLGMDRRL